MLSFSIVTAVLNRSDVIQSALASVQEQTHPEIQHILVDGASTDGTLEKLKRYTNGQSILLSEPDAGIYNALNKGIALATGDILGILHSDDFFATSDCLAVVAMAFEDPAINVVYGNLEYVSKHDPKRVIRLWRACRFMPIQLSLGWMPPHPTLFVRRELFQKLGLYDERYRIAADYELILRYFGSNQVKSQYIDQVLVKMRTGGESNRSLRRILTKSKEDLQALRSTGRRLWTSLFTLFCKNVRKLHQFRHLG